jgi:hypothetical protein
LLVAPLLVAPLLVAPLLVAPLLVAPLLVAPLLVAPLLVAPLLVAPTAGPSDGESVGLVLAPPVTGELDAGGVGVEGVLPAVDEDAGAAGLAVSDGLAVSPGQEGVAVALADAVAFPPVLAWAEAVELVVLASVAVSVAGAVVVVVSPGLVLPPPGLSLVPLADALPDGLPAELAGVPLGVADVVGLAALAGADDAEPDGHPIAGALP